MFNIAAGLREQKDIIKFSLAITVEYKLLNYIYAIKCELLYTIKMPFLKEDIFLIFIKKIIVSFCNIQLYTSVLEKLLLYVIKELVNVLSTYHNFL